MLSKDDVLGVSKLARLKLTDEQVDKFHAQLSNVFELFQELDKIDVSEVVETSQVSGLENITREDVVKYDDDLRPEKNLLKNTLHNLAQHLGRQSFSSVFEVYFPANNRRHQVSQ